MGSPLRNRLLTVFVQLGLGIALGMTAKSVYPPNRSNDRLRMHQHRSSSQAPAWNFSTAKPTDEKTSDGKTPASHAKKHGKSDAADNSTTKDAAL